MKPHPPDAPPAPSQPPSLSATQMLKLSEAADPAVRNGSLSVLAAFCKAGGGYAAIGARLSLPA